MILKVMDARIFTCINLLLYHPSLQINVSYSTTTRCRIMSPILPPLAAPLPPLATTPLQYSASISAVNGVLYCSILLPLPQFSESPGVPASRILPLCCFLSRLQYPYLSAISCLLCSILPPLQYHASIPWSIMPPLHYPASPAVS